VIQTVLRIRLLSVVVFLFQRGSLALVAAAEQ
jgi:hypothetical protein